MRKIDCLEETTYYEVFYFLDLDNPKINYENKIPDIESFDMAKGIAMGLLYGNSMIKYTCVIKTTLGYVGSEYTVVDSYLVFDCWDEEDTKEPASNPATYS